LYSFFFFLQYRNTSNNKLNFNCYINKQANYFLIIVKSTTLQVPLPPKDSPSTNKKTIIASFSASTKRITEAIKKMSKDSKGKSEFICVDEYLISQTCNKCKTKTSTNITTANSKRKLHAVLKCDSCNTVWNRDVLASLNINYIF
jgi:hypothetical protein